MFLKFLSCRLSAQSSGFYINFGISSWAFRMVRRAGIFLSEIEHQRVNCDGPGAATWNFRCSGCRSEQSHDCQVVASLGVCDSLFEKWRVSVEAVLNEVMSNKLSIGGDVDAAVLIVVWLLLQIFGFDKAGRLTPTFKDETKPSLISMWRCRDSFPIFQRSWNRLK